MQVIQRAHREEAQDLSELAFQSKAHWPYPSKYLEDSKAALRITEDYLEKWDVRVLKENDKKIGFYAFCIEEGQAVLDHLWVEPAYIGTGKGRKLFEAAVVHAREMGWKNFKIVSDPYALKFYLKLGAKQEGQIESKYLKGLFLPILKLTLS